MSAPSVIERIKTTLVALYVTLRGIERGEIDAVDAIDALLTKELTTRVNRRVRWRSRWPGCRRSKPSPVSTLPSSPRSTGTASWRSPDCSSSIAPKRSIL